MVLIAYSQNRFKTTYADVSSVDRGLNSGWSLRLRPYFWLPSSEGSGESTYWFKLRFVVVQAIGA